MNTIVCVMGPTASGKTDLAVRLAAYFGTEVVSADSMQIYRHMDIGTAKPNLTERQGVLHHMLDILEPCEDYSAARYATDAGACVDELLSRGVLPVVAGGTGLYVDALIGTRSFENEPDTRKIRARLQEEAAVYGSAVLYARLAAVDPERAAQLHPNDEKRIVRALEIFEATGETATQRDRRAAARTPRYRAVKIGLNWPDALSQSVLTVAWITCLRRAFWKKLNAYAACILAAPRRRQLDIRNCSDTLTVCVRSTKRGKILPGKPAAMQNAN